MYLLAFNLSEIFSDPVFIGGIIVVVGSLVATFRRKNRIPENALLSAAMDRDLERFKQELSRKKVDVNQINLNGFTPLIAATLFLGQKYIIEALLDRGAHIDWQDRYGNTALHYATQRSKKTLVKLFIERGANTELQNEEGQSPQEIAEKNGKPDIISLFKD